MAKKLPISKASVATKKLREARMMGSDPVSILSAGRMTGTSLPQVSPFDVGPAVGSLEDASESLHSGRMAAAEAETVAGGLGEAASGVASAASGVASAASGATKGLLGRALPAAGAALALYSLANLAYKATIGKQNQATAGAAIDQMGLADQLADGQELRVGEGDANRLNALLHGRAQSAAFAAQQGLDSRDIELQSLLAGSEQQLAQMSSVEPPSLAENLALARMVAGV